MGDGLAPEKRSECADQVRHQAQQKARAEVGMWLLNYADEHGLSDLDMLTILNEATTTFLRYADRDDEERRTGFRHRLAGE